MFWFYNIVLSLTAPFWVPWMYWRSSQRKEKPNWKERSGRYPIKLVKGSKRIWVHAVSVGEVMASLPLLKELSEELSDYEIVLSVTTSSGHQTAREHAQPYYSHLVYFPIDTARFQLSAMSLVRPQALLIMETELWYNFLWAAKVFDTRILLVNGRISDRSFPRSKKLKFFYKNLLQMVDRCLMQTETDKERILALGASSAEVFGNVKFDQAVEGLDIDAAKLRAELGIPDKAQVVVIGSTRGSEEEDLVLAGLAELVSPDLWIIHAPRHLERVPELETKVRTRFGTVALRSKKEAGGYLILDTYGELAKIYSIADVVIIGGGFENLGGQNLLQALAHGKPVIHGPHMQNFKEGAELAAKNGATRIVSTSAELQSTLRELLGNPEIRRQMGDAAKMTVIPNLGASKRYVQAVKEELAHFQNNSR